MLQRQITLREAEIGMTFVAPAGFVVGTLLFLPTGKETGRAFIGIAKILAENAGGVCEMNNVIAEEKIVLDDVPNEPAKKSDVAAGADGHPDISQRASTREPRIDVNNRCAFLLCLHNPAKTDWMRFGHRRAFD